MVTSLLFFLLLLPDLDLPVVPPKLGDKQPVPVEPEIEDPRDTPAPVFYGHEIEAVKESIFYVVDRSGSMQSMNTLAAYTTPDGKITKGNRWDRAKSEAIKSIRGLGDNLKFGILTYNCSMNIWRPKLVEATETNKKACETWLMRQYWADGMTGTGPATVLGLAFKPDTLILLTDGEPNCGSKNHRAMISQHNTGTPIHVFGIAAKGRWRALCQAIAADSGGRYVDVP